MTKIRATRRRPTGACIFCGSSDLSREHVWADWLKEYIKKDALNHSRMDATLHPTISEYERQKVSGDLRSHRLKVVCRSCNSGWMSRLQKQAKPYLLPLLKGETVSIDAAAQEIISAWITMFVMVAEYFNPYKVSTSQEQRRRFFDDPKCPVNWKIWIGDFDRENWPGLLVHFALPISSAEHVPETMDNGLPRPNTQTMTFVVGRLYVHVCASVTDLFANWTVANSRLLALICPAQQSVVPWPMKTLSDRDADSIAAAFHLESERIARLSVSG